MTHPSPLQAGLPRNLQDFRWWLRQPDLVLHPLTAMPEDRARFVSSLQELEAFVGWSGTAGELLSCARGRSWVARGVASVAGGLLEFSELTGVSRADSLSVRHTSTSVTRAALAGRRRTQVHN